MVVACIAGVSRNMEGDGQPTPISDHRDKYCDVQLKLDQAEQALGSAGLTVKRIVYHQCVQQHFTESLVHPGIGGLQSRRQSYLVNHLRCVTYVYAAQVAWAMTVAQRVLNLIA